VRFRVKSSKPLKKNAGNFLKNILFSVVQFPNNICTSGSSNFPFGKPLPFFYHYIPFWEDKKNISAVMLELSRNEG
jgi:hypothetical protein